MARFFYILGIIIHYSFLYLLIRLGFYKKPQEKLLTNFFEEAGGSFIKFGQMLAMRVDFLPKEYSLELLDLLDNVKPFSYKDAEIIFIQELGATPDKIFKDFQKEPFASASFGQVHAAKLEDDTIVAVKVMRPGIEDDVEVDFFFINLLAIVGDFFFRIKALPWKEVAKEYKRWTLNELDYRIEAEYADKLYKFIKPTDLVVIPKSYHRYSTRRILVQEYIQGIPLSRALRGLRDGRITKEQLLDMGIDITKAPRTLVREILRQYFFFGTFHADPHPGNVLLLQDNRLALIDFGIVGEASASNNRALIRTLMAIGEVDYEKATYHFADFAGGNIKRLVESALPASLDPAQIDEFMQGIAKYFSKTVKEIVAGKVQDLENLKTDYTMVYMELFKAAESFDLKLPKETSILFRAITIVGLLCKEIDWTFKMALVMKNFFQEFPEDIIIRQDSSAIPYQRINRERALEQLNNWLAYLFEKDPKLYHVVNDYVKKYNVINK